MVEHRQEWQTRSLAILQRLSDCHAEDDGVGDAPARTANRRLHGLVISAHAGGLAGARPFHGLSTIRQTEHPLADG